MMRRTAIIGICLLLLLGGCDCEDDDGNGPPSDTGVSDTADDAVTDAADDAVTDAADDAVTDAGDDADGSQTGEVELTFIDEGQPVSGAAVIVHAPDGSVESQSTTDGSGQASPTVTSGDMVTVVTGTGGQALPRYFTATDVEPGNDILIDIPTDIGNRLSDVEVTLPGPFQGISEAGVYIGCDTATGQDVSQPITLAVRDNCPQGGDVFDVVAIVRDANSDPVAYAVAEDVQRNQSGLTQVTLTSWQTSFDTFEVTLDGFPAGSFVETDFRTRANGVEVRDRFEPAQPGAGVTSQIFTFEYAPGYADAIDYSTFFGNPLSTFGNTATGVLRRDSDPTPGESVTVSVSQLLPTFDSLEMDGTSTPRPSFAWSTSPVVSGGSTIDEADGGVVSYQWADGTSGRWTVWIPSDRTEFQLPELPASLPAPSGSPTAARVFFYDFESVSNYSGFLSNPFTRPLLGPPENLSNGRFTLGGEGS